MIVSLSIFNWVKTDFDTSFVYLTNEDKERAYFEASSFEGKFVYCEGGCGVSKSDSGYALMVTNICEFYDDYKEIPISNFYTDWDPVKSICEMFKHLLVAAQFKLLLDVISFFFIVSWFISMLCMIRRKSCKNCCYYYTFLSSLCSCLTFFAGSIIWFAFSTATFNDCSDKPKDGKVPNICATTGPILMILKMILFSILVLCYFFVVYNSKKSNENQNNTNQHINNIQNTQNIGYNNNQNPNLLLHALPQHHQLPNYPQGPNNIMLPNSAPQLPPVIILAKNIEGIKAIIIGDASGSDNSD